MAVIPFRSKRNGIEKTGEIGQVGGIGKAYLITTEPDTEMEQRKKEGLLKIEIGFLPVTEGGQLESELYYIETTFGEAYISPNGKIVSEVKKCRFLTNEPDKAGFTQQLADLFYRFAFNGKVRAYDRNNDKPIFYSADVKDTNGNIIHYAGQVIEYTEEQENAEPTGGYYQQPTPPTEPA